MNSDRIRDASPTALFVSVYVLRMQIYQLLIKLISFTDIFNLFYYTMAVNDRLKEIRQFLKMTQKEMANILSISQNSYSYIESGKVSLTDKNRKILIEKLDINPDFLDEKNKRYFIHDGSFMAAVNMASDNERAILDSALNGTENKKKNKMETRPRVPLTAAAGSLSGECIGVTLEQCEQMPLIHQIPYYDFTMFIKGDSMSPRFESGDEIACRRIDQSRFIQWGKVHVLDTTQGFIIKRIYDDGDKIRCVSYNKDYADFSVPKEDIHSISLVVGSVSIMEM